MEYTGSLCASVSLLTREKAKKKPRQIIRKRKKVMYILMGYIHSGIMLAPEKEEKNLNLKIGVNFQTIHEKFKGTKQTRNPIFNSLLFQDIDIYDELENFSNLDIVVFNKVSVSSLLKVKLWK